MNERSIFMEALDLSDPREQEALLLRVCGGDEQLRARVEALLRSHKEATGFVLDRAPGFDASATVDTTSSLDGPGTVIGPYKLLEPIGEGGMGTVYMAEQATPVRRKVALKVIKAGMDTRQVVARFEAERQTLALMDHPNIAKVHDAGTTETGRPYFVMELVHGIPITDYCDRERLTIPERQELFVLVCRAVQHAHQKGIIHRDIKPSNVLVTVIDGAAVPKVIDFGVAKATGDQINVGTLFTGFHQCVGTPLYMSPEQAGISGIDVDTRSDVYSLGVLLYELLTGSTPLEGETFRKAALGELQRIIREDEPPKPSTRLSNLGDDRRSSVSANRHTDVGHLGRSLRGELDWIVMKCLEKDRRRRYETVNGLAADVMRHLTDRPVEACPPSAGYRLTKFARRNRLAISTAAVVATALVLGTAVSIWQAILARQAERNAVAAWAEEGQQRTRAVNAENLARSSEQTALAEARKAKLSQADTQAFSNFLVNDMLAVARPEGVQGGLGVRVTVAEALEVAEKHLEERFAQRPLAEATARDAIGKTWRNLTKYEQAERHLRRAVELRERELGADDLETLNSRNSLGVLLSQAGRYVEAIAIHEETLKTLKAKLGPEHPDTLNSMSNLADAYQGTGQFDQALSLYEETLKKRQMRLGPENRDTLLSMISLAMAYRDQGQYNKAEPLHLKALEVGRRVLREEDTITLASIGSLGALYWSKNEYAKAEPLLVKALAGRRRVLTAYHAHTLRSMMDLATLYHSQGQDSKAEPLVVEALEVSRRVLGEEHPDTLTSMKNLATWFWFARKLDRSVALFEELLKRYQAKWGPDHPMTLNMMANLGINYRDAGRSPEGTALLEQAWKMAQKQPGLAAESLAFIAEALADTYDQAGQFAKSEPLYRQSLEEAGNRDGESSLQAAGALARLGLSLLKQQKYADAESLLRDSLRIREEKEPDAWSTFNTRSMLGGSLLGQRHYDEAEPLLLAGYEGLNQREGKIPAPVKQARLTEALERVVQLYDAWGQKEQKEKADAWRAKLTEAKSAKPAEKKDD